MLVDCGIHQERELRSRDFGPFPVGPETIDAVLLTHAHLDHCGYLPKLKKGTRIEKWPGTIQKWLMKTYWKN